MNPERANREQGKSQRQRVRQLGRLLSRKPFPSKKLYPSQSSHTEKQLILPCYWIQTYMLHYTGNFQPIGFGQNRRIEYSSSFWDKHCLLAHGGAQGPQFHFGDSSSPDHFATDRSSWSPWVLTATRAGQLSEGAWAGGGRESPHRHRYQGGCNPTGFEHSGQRSVLRRGSAGGPQQGKATRQIHKQQGMGPEAGLGSRVQRADKLRRTSLQSSESRHLADGMSPLELNGVTPPPMYFVVLFLHFETKWDSDEHRIACKPALQLLQ